MVPDYASRLGGLEPGFHPPPRTGTVGMLLFLAALFMLFAAGMLGYVLVRVKASVHLPFGAVHLPHTLWVSTVLVVSASLTIHRALHELRRERLAAFRNWLLATLLLAIGFVVVQTPSLLALLREHEIVRKQQVALYGLIFVLILLHALHVVGGIVSLGLTMHHARRNAYDHENYQPVRYAALYWHFLDAVWFVMFFTFLLMR